MLRNVCGIALRRHVDAHVLWEEGEGSACHVSCYHRCMYANTIALDVRTRFPLLAAATGARCSLNEDWEFTFQEENVSLSKALGYRSVE